METVYLLVTEELCVVGTDPVCGQAVNIDENCCQLPFLFVKPVVTFQAAVFTAL